MVVQGVAMLVPVIMGVRPVRVFHELDLVAVIVQAMTQHEIDPEAVRLRYLVPGFPEAALVGKGEQLARAVRAERRPAAG